MFTKFQRCRGLRLFRWRHFQIELWYCPKHELIPWHCHPNIKSTYLHLKGRVLWQTYMGKLGDKIKSKLLSNWDFCYIHTLAEGVYHSAFTLSPILFLNIERWTCEPTSAAVNYKPL